MDQNLGAGATNPITFTVGNNDGNKLVSFGITPLYAIGGIVFLDNNHDQKYELAAGDQGYSSGGTITVTGGPTSVTPITVGGDGTWATPTNLLAGTYTVTFTSSLPPGYTFMTPSNWTVTVGNPTGSPTCSTGSSPDAVCGGTNGGSVSNLNFGINPPYQIAGRIFSDVNKDQRYNTPPDSLYTGGSTVTVTGPTFPSGHTFSASGGTYTTGQILLPGTYTVAYDTGATPLPPTTSFTTPAVFQVTVGVRCTSGVSLDATCGDPNGGSITTLDFGLTDENAVKQGACLDMRNDATSGTYTEPLPASLSCGGNTQDTATITNGSCQIGAGIVFSCDAPFDFGLGAANSQNWTVGGSDPQEQDCFKGAGLPVVRTSYDYLSTTARESNITPTDMNDLTVCGAGGIDDCTLDANLPKGIYAADGDVYLNAYTFPAPPDPSTVSFAYIFLIKGNLHLLGNVLIPRGSVAAFSASGTIYVDKTVGQTVSSATVGSTTVNAPNLEGLYSADGSFIVESASSGTGGTPVCNADGTPLDKKLNIVGSVTTNAAQNGGTFLNQRDLCLYDRQCPTINLGDGINSSDQGLLLSYLLTLYADGGFLQHRNFNWEEVKP